MKTLLNKLIAILLILGGYVCFKIDNDCTVLIFMILLALPVLLGKNDIFC